MKRTLIVLPALLLFLVGSFSYADNWEVMMDPEAKAQRLSLTAGDTRHDWRNIQSKRRMQLERGFDRESLVDIENLPPTAAGPRHSHSMRKNWKEIETNRRRHLERGGY